MPKQVIRKCLSLILLSSIYQISCAKTEKNQTVSSDPSEFFLDSAPDSNQETVSPGNGVPIFVTEDQSANDTAPEHEGPDFFSPELKPEANGYATSQITTPAAAPLADVTLPEIEVVSEKPEAMNNSEIQVESPAPLAGFPLLPETKSLSPESELSVQLPETETVTRAPLLSNADSSALQSEVDHYNTPTETTESAPTEESTSALEVDTGSTKEAIRGVDVDDGVDMPPVPNNPSDFQSNYRAEDETVDIVHEEYNSGWGSWNGQNNLVVAGVAIGVCFVSLAGFVFNTRKNKKTQFQYQSLSKGV